MDTNHTCTNRSRAILCTCNLLQGSLDSGKVTTETLHLFNETYNLFSFHFHLFLVYQSLGRYFINDKTMAGLFKLLFEMFTKEQDVRMSRRNSEEP